MRRVAGRLRVLRVNFREPFREILLVILPRIERAEHVTADALRVFEHKRQVWFEPHVGTDEDVAERFGIVEQMRGVVAIIAGAQADLVNGFFVARLASANVKGRRNH